MTNTKLLGFWAKWRSSQLKAKPRIRAWGPCSPGPTDFWIALCFWMFFYSFGHIIWKPWLFPLYLIPEVLNLPSVCCFVLFWNDFFPREYDTLNTERQESAQSYSHGGALVQVLKPTTAFAFGREQSLGVGGMPWFESGSIPLSAPLLPTSYESTFASPLKPSCHPLKTGKLEGWVDCGPWIFPLPRALLLTWGWRSGRISEKESAILGGSVSMVTVGHYCEWEKKVFNLPL